ncbi:MAG: alpha/beta hydrolase [Stagnimonas sp.]|nr:alpha/beta hydrolase [Stagnimonas sp.]
MSNPLEAPLSLRAYFMKLGARLLIRPALHEPDMARRRQRVDALSRFTWPAGGATYTHGNLGGVPVEWVAHPASGARGFVLYLHGGAYVVGSPRSHRALTSRLAQAARICVAALDYRLAPEHPFPAALDDAVAAYRALLAQDISASKIIIAGDSAGGGLALALALRLKSEPLPQPAGIVCLSPWTDLSMSGESVKSRAALEVMLSEQLGRDSARHYLQTQDPTLPLASPLFADLAGLAPVFIQVGGQEILHDDATRFAQRASAQGVPVTLQTWPNLWHVWQLHAGLMPEANAAITAIASFIHARLTGKL